MFLIPCFVISAVPRWSDSWSAPIVALLDCDKKDICYGKFNKTLNMFSYWFEFFPGPKCLARVPCRRENKADFRKIKFKRC